MPKIVKWKIEFLLFFWWLLEVKKNTVFHYSNILRFCQMTSNHLLSLASHEEIWEDNQWLHRRDQNIIGFSNCKCCHKRSVLSEKVSQENLNFTTLWSFSVLLLAPLWTQWSRKTLLFTQFGKNNAASAVGRKAKNVENGFINETFHSGRKYTKNVSYFAPLFAVEVVEIYVGFSCYFSLFEWVENETFFSNFATMCSALSNLRIFSVCVFMTSS